MWGWGGARGDCGDEGPTGGASERHKTNAKASARPAWATARSTPVFGCFPPSARAVRSRRFKLLCPARTAVSLHWYTEALISLIKVFVKQLCGCCPLGRTQKRPLTRMLAFGRSQVYHAQYTLHHVQRIKQTAKFRTRHHTKYMTPLNHRAHSSQDLPLYAVFATCHLSQTPRTAANVIFDDILQ